MTSRADCVQEAIDTRRRAINTAIPAELPVKKPERLYQASRHLLEAGGKRLRPVVFLLVAESLVDVDPDTVEYREFPDLHDDVLDIMAGAVSIEIIHLFTLIHDDIMDQDDLRRGVSSVHRAYDMETAILAGDTLYSKAFEIMLKARAPPDRTIKVLQRLASTCTEICEGQALDIAFESRETVSIEEYHDMIRLKTAVLYGASASLPAILLGASDRTIDELYQYGIEVGQAFQIQDDVLDLVASSTTLGKQRGSDLLEGKQTLITSHAAANGVDVHALFDTDAAGFGEDDVDQIVSVLEDSGSIDFARDTAREFVASGKQRLSVLPQNDSRALLEHIADFLIEREY